MLGIHNTIADHCWVNYGTKPYLLLKLIHVNIMCHRMPLIGTLAHYRNDVLLYNILEELNYI